MTMKKNAFTIIFLCFICFLAGCKSADGNSSLKNPDVTIGSVVQIISPKSVQVEGVGLVGGLNGKGSSECPPEIRQYLSQFILSELSSEDKISIDNLINSLNTAVVLIEGILPVEDSGNSYFDSKVTAYRGTQTVSLENGWLYRSELKIVGSFGINTEILADVEGPVFTDHISESPIDKRTGYILGGGNIKAKYIIGLVLGKNDFEATNNIRNRLNFRFGDNIARAARAGMIEVALPAKYREQRGKFIELLKATYVYDVPQNDQERITKHIKQLIENPESDEGEIALEAMGNQCLSQLYSVLKSPDEHVRLRAARCMLNLRSDEGMNVLKEIVLNKLSPYRVEALRAVTESGRSLDASTLALELLKDESFNIRLAAYEQLRKLRDISIAVRPTESASVFFVEKLTQAGRKEIYVSRSGQPKVVLFGSPIYCNKGFTIQSKNGEVTITAPIDQDYVTVTRKYPNRPDLTGQIRCTNEIDSIIHALCDDPPEKGQRTRGGLGVSYSDLIALLKQMCDKGAINAEFHAGTMPKIDLIVKK
ncbi:MAG: flagellar basal body P-ring protein FlgI [Sedimentisphaerales bacterium]|nr:flagellar basal body P-ring protein FlgI [Sedimentisphaerales bacterium]